MNDEQPFLEQITENDIVVYKLPSGFSLFKAFRMTKEEEIQPFINGQPYFFGIKNMSPKYIESYEEEYGIIYEFETTRPYTLLALDNPLTQQILFDSAPENIQNILKNNYGYVNKLRDSKSDSDRILSQYLCEKGYDGYALHGMRTYGGGVFHDEIMICKADSIKMIGLVTLSPERKAILFQNNKAKEISSQLRDSRRKKRESVLDMSSPFTSSMPLPSKKLERSLFDDDDDDDDFIRMRGGRKTKKHRSKILRKKHITRRKKKSTKKKPSRKSSKKTYKK